jgi:hypothetical protein
MGYSDAEHTSSAGYKYTEASEINSTGQIIGFSNRYDSFGNPSGQSAWLFDGTASISLGLTSSEFVRGDGYKYSEAQKLNENGQVVGYTSRFNGFEELGQTAWLFDPALGQTIPMVLSVSGDGYSWSEIEYLGEDGLVLGRYDLFQPGGSEFGSARAFYFTSATGICDLGALVQDGIPSDDWDSLAVATRVNIAGQILGEGVLPGDAGGGMPFIMTPRLMGDFDNDGDVDGRDFLTWQRDPIVGNLIDWQANYGTGSLRSVLVVPEPETFFLLGMLAIARFLPRRRGD